ncbi:MAG: hypothetical protein MUP03_09970 [Anaerolineales bacterium]|nr:hypothetical protein [Anaerolineales bacterium]
MQLRKTYTLTIIVAGCALVIVSMFMSLPVSSAKAQCGSQISSCKNCHEVQAQMPVNQDGTGWHQSHAFGDFCEFCHGGNVQSIVKEESHVGMVAPLSDLQTNCGSCHPSDLKEKAQVYAVALGVEVDTGAGGATTSGETKETGSSTTPPPKAAPEVASPEIVVESSQMVDYYQRYEEVTLGRKPFDWGDLTLGVLIILVLVGGGGFVFWNERRLHHLARKVAPERPAAKAAATTVPEFKEYPQEIIAMLPKLTGLTPVGRRALHRLLETPDEASDLLFILSQVDPELLRRIRGLDGKSRALLLALAGID